MQRSTDVPSADEAGSSAEEPAPPTVVLKVPAGEVARICIVVLGVGVGFYLLWTLHEVLFLLVLGILLATAIEPLVNRLRRGPFNRGTGVLAVFTAIVVAIGLPTLVLAPSLAAQADAFAETIPERIGTLRPYAAQLRPKALQDVALGAIDRVREAVRNPAPARQEDLVEVGTKAAHALLGFFSVLFIAFY